MGWVKTILLFQTFMTLFIGIAFFYQVLELDNNKISELRVEVKGGILYADQTPETNFMDIKKRYTVAAWLLFVVSLIEFLLIARLSR